ncbi:DUF7673 family protein [Paraburkholderia phytofirmans]|uniref:DUF7673 domain-containing protein n=1 Tax=Paraburkholderia phytofirmans (strain DSM 17436 / LMG 22146 / PsJN) TaxID=398527 RepID=B2TH30_PARPJ|nr:hypothetical protein [Paraburkholderia phytofirmans]ACD21579.1 conserved hypothetical protein [Paraburkholderia phytofirmans PsJN]
MEKITVGERAALERLIGHAQRETGQARRVADFLLAWWNPSNCGGFDITTAWGLDEEIAADVVTVFGLAVRCNSYPDTLGYKNQFEHIVRAWRPELVS